VEIAAAMKRFYKEVAVAQDAADWRVLLDGRAIKTAGRSPQVIPTHALAEAMAAEWAGQGDEIDLAAFTFRDMLDYAIDVVAADRAQTIREILAYAETDTLCYRDEAGEPLELRQREVWEPLLASAEARWDIHFERIGGIIHRPQPAATLARLEAVLNAESDFALAALRTLAGLAASLTIALAAIAPDANVDALWDAANLEEDWQADLWGKDAEALALRARRLADFKAAARFAELARG
jgi:chaperone required for assembly of F1-ATPase